MREDIEIGYQAFVSGGVEEFGAVREVSFADIVVSVENARDFLMPLDAVETVYLQRVIFKREKLDRRLRKAIRHAHDSRRAGCVSHRSGKSMWMFTGPNHQRSNFDNSKG